MSYTPLHGFQSEIGTNSTITALSASATFTGTGEQNSLPDVMVSCYSDTAGTLYFDFSVDNTNWRTFPTAGFTVSAGIHEFHTAVKGPRYFRVRYVDGGTGNTTFQLYTYYGWFAKAPNAPLNQTIADDADAQIVKSVISGVGDTTVKVTDHRALQVTLPPESKTAFGELSTVEPTPIIQLKFAYNVGNSQLIKDQAYQSGTVTYADNMMVATSGAAANSGAIALSNKFINYRGGEGVAARFTGLFTTGVANSEQLVGIGDAHEGFFFGYNGTAFGVLRRKGGAPEIRTLTVSTKSTTAENITITLDGDAHTTVAVTDATAGDTTTTANDIAAADYSDIGYGWTATAVGSKVVFTSWQSGSKTGTYSLSSATTAVGSFAQTLAGADHTDTWVAQASWNGADIFDGNGLSGVTLDPTKGNVYQIKFQYLGYGLISFHIEDPDDGEMHLVHAIEYANANTSPSIENPSLPLSVQSVNSSNTSSLVVKTASMAAFIEGKDALIGPRKGIQGDVTLGATTTETPFLTLRVKEVFNSVFVRSKIKLLFVSCSADHTKPVAVKFYVNATLTAASFSDVSSESIAEYDTSATAFTGGTYLFSVLLGKDGQEVIDLTDHMEEGVINPGDSLTATIAPKSGNSAEASASFYFVELI